MRRFLPLLLVLLAACLPLADVLSAGPQEKKARPPRKVAFLVGVGEFKFNPRNLGAAPKRDVTELAKTLKAGGFEVVTLTDEDATKQAIEARYRAVLDGDGDAAKALGKKDMLLVALCSHGFAFEVEANGVKQWEPFVCGHDSKVGDNRTMVSLNGLLKAAEANAPTTLFLVDACRELADPNRGTRGIEGRRINLPERTAVLFSCGQGQLSHQSDELGGGHGLFTFAVLRALRDSTRDVVSWGGVVDGVQQAFLSAEFRKHIPAGREQEPVLATGEMKAVQLFAVNRTIRLLPEERVEEFEYFVNDEVTPRKGKRKVLTLELGGGQSMDFVRIEPGEFIIGGPDGEKNPRYELPERKTQITKAYYLGKFEVTQTQYKAVTGNNPSDIKGDDYPAVVPVTAIASFSMTISNRAKRTFSLPTEVQWEYACRAGTRTRYSWGEKYDPPRANYASALRFNSGSFGPNHPTLKPPRVGSYPPNPWGLHDMHGNEWELCRMDEGAKPRWVIRGGAYYNDPAQSRSFVRLPRDEQEDFPIGFRVCLELE